MEDRYAVRSSCVRKEFCPVCSKKSFFIKDEDRFFHIDGTDNRTCWFEILRGNCIGKG